MNIFSSITVIASSIVLAVLGADSPTKVAVRSTLLKKFNTCLVCISLVIATLVALTLYCLIPIKSIISSIVEIEVNAA